jgi:hypothetical protein
MCTVRHDTLAKTNMRSNTVLGLGCSAARTGEEIRWRTPPNLVRSGRQRQDEDERGSPGLAGDIIIEKEEDIIAAGVHPSKQ